VSGQGQDGQAGQVLVVLSGQEDYQRILRLQEGWVAALDKGLVEELIWIGSHPLVITLGRRGGEADLHLDQADLAARGVAVVPISRGGLATLHGPGQIVAYPIIKLKGSHLGIRGLVWRLEEAMIQTLAQLGLITLRSEVNPGVWVGEKKIGFLGLAVTRGITYHGLALNLNLDPALFEMIVPCGLDGVAVTSAGKLLGRRIDLDQAGRILALELAGLLDRRPEYVSLAEAERRLEGAKRAGSG